MNWYKKAQQNIKQPDEFLVSQAQGKATGKAIHDVNQIITKYYTAIDIGDEKLIDQYENAIRLFINTGDAKRSKQMVEGLITKWYHEKALEATKTKTAQTQNKPNITFKKPSNFNPNKHAIVNIDVDKFDKDWSKSYFYVPRNKVTMTNPEKLKFYKDKFQNNKDVEIEMTEVKIGEELG